MEKSNDCYVDIEVLFRRKIFGEGEYHFFRRRRKTGKKEKRNWKRSLQNLSRILKSHGVGFGLETFANLWRVLVSVSENLVSDKKSQFLFRKIWSRQKKYQYRRIWSWKKSLGFDFGESGLGKKASVSENKGSGFQAAWPQKLFLIFSDILVDIVDQP